MTIKRLSSLQWFALLGGAVALAFGHLAGLGLTVAECNVNGPRWNIANDAWEIAIEATAVCAMLLAGAASALIISRTQGTSYDDDPPLSRVRFFAIAALVANALFTIVVLLDLFGNVFNAVCRQS
ncbi:MAG TPA: hypothetical protein VGU02_10060 [Gaiellaceae bacterium]|nr:hypothetical protein [Gaiellaceae bacterium]